MNIQKKTRKKCPVCGKHFDCMGDDDCWCEKLRIHRKELIHIMNTYKDCLCPDCLKSFEE